MMAAPSWSAQVLYLDFEDGSGTVVTDREGKTNGTLKGKGAASSWVEGKNGKAVRFSGDNYVEVPYKFPDNGSVALWFKPDSLYNYNTVFDNSVHENRWEMWIQGEVPPGNPSWYECPHCVKFRTGQDSKGKTGYDLYNLGTKQQVTEMWIHFAATWTSSGESKLYVNGTLRDTQNSPDFQSAGNMIFLGANKNPVPISSAPSGNPRARGSMDEFRIFDSVLSASEIQALYANSTTAALESADKLTGVSERFAISRRGETLSIESFDHPITSITLTDLQGRQVGSYKGLSSQSFLITLPSMHKPLAVKVETGYASKGVKIAPVR